MYVIYLEEVLNSDRRHPMCSVSTLTNTPPQQLPTVNTPPTPHQHPTTSLHQSHRYLFFTILKIHVYLSDIILELKQVRVVFTLLFTLRTNQQHFT